MKSILFIHQSAELYGSDKTILMFISNLDKNKYLPVVILPFDGPLRVEFEKNNIKVIISPVLKLYRKMFTPKNILKFFKEYKDGIKALDKLHKEYNFKLVYSHTLAALIGISFAKKNQIKHLWHVQEIIAKPKLFNFLFKKILALKSNHKIIYDSKETMNFWIKDNQALIKKSDFIWNGLDVNQKSITSQANIDVVRKDYFGTNENTIVIGLVGRINSWKGQQLLLKAFSSVADKHLEAKLVFIGSAPPNQEFFETDLINKIKTFNLEDRVKIIPFQNNIWQFWDALDIAVVPSTEPEPFGMVAIEAMMAKKPVIAANHGGLTEIVVANKTGILFDPNNDKALASAIVSLLNKPELRKDFGDEGYIRANTVFSLQNHVDKFEKTFEELI